MKSKDERRPAWDEEYLNSLIENTARLPKARYSCFPPLMRVGRDWQTSREWFFTGSAAPSGGNSAPLTSRLNAATNNFNDFTTFVNIPDNPVSGGVLRTPLAPPTQQSYLSQSHAGQFDPRHSVGYFAGHHQLVLAQAAAPTSQFTSAPSVQNMVYAQFTPIQNYQATPSVETELVFTPSTTIPHSSTAHLHPSAGSQLMSDNYMGNRDLPSNYSADHIPDHCNTSLWIFGLPSQITVHQLLKTIRGFGRIFAIHINEPEIDKGHFLAAAKVTFFEAAAAQRFLFKHRSSGLPVGSLIASVRPNRVKVEEKQFSESCSRVIVAIGPRELTTQAWIHDQLRRRGIYYDIDEILEHTNHPAGSARLEFRFGSYRGQASQAYRVLRGSEARERGIVVFFGEDPCA